jgi:primosomal protein N' (replication factor Y)
VTPEDPVDDEQLALVRAPAARARKVKPVEDLAATDPVARVAVDVGLPHLDRLFDYTVPASLHDGAVAGARVRVRFSGRLVDGFVLERAADTDHAGGVAKLARLAKVVSPEPVLTPEVARLARAVADRYAGTLSDVLRLAVPPRHARTEQAAPPEPAAHGPVIERETTIGAGLLDALAGGAAPRAVWDVPAGADWPRSLAVAAATTAAAGRGAVLVVPDARDVARVEQALVDVLPVDAFVALTADLGPAERYRRFLAVARGGVRVVVGTRAAAFAPVTDVGLVAMWDDGDDLHADPRAPYPHVREVLGLRAHLSGAAFLLAAHARTAEAERLVTSGWARALVPSRADVRASAPRIRTIGDDAELARDAAARSARLPSLAWDVARRGLLTGPVLVQVPRRGYAPALACQRCRTSARCTHCAGPLAATSAGSAPACRWCGKHATAWTCAECGFTRMRAVVVGSRRTAEELARAFPSTLVRTSGRDAVLSSVPAKPALVVATPGAEPYVEGGAGYAAALLLDGDQLLSRTDLRAGEEALRRWFNAAALVRSSGAGGEVVVVADPASPAVQALVRWDPAGFAARELADRATVHLPPAARVATVTGKPVAVRDLLALADLPVTAEVLGPVPVDESADVGGDDDLVRTLVRVPIADGPALSAALHAAAGVRSAKKAPDVATIRIDPQVIS